MEKFETFTGIVCPLDRSNVDTDAIIPKQFLKSIKRSGFGPNLFDEWRYLDHRITSYNVCYTKLLRCLSFPVGFNPRGGWRQYDSRRLGCAGCRRA